MAKRGTLEHPKTLTLADELGIMDCFALGILEAFWQYVSKYHEDGDVSSLRPGSMARSIRYTGDAEKLWQAMIVAGFLDVLEDGRVIVHDWSEHCEDSVHTKLYRAIRRFADGSIPKSRSVGTKEKEKLDGLWTSENRPTDVPPKPMPKPMPSNSPPTPPPGGDGEEKPAEGEEAGEPEGEDPPEDQPKRKARRTWDDVCREMCAALPQHAKNLEIWFKYRPRKPGGVWIEDTVNQNIELWRHWPVERLGAAIEHSIRNSYQGIYEPKVPARAVVQSQSFDDSVEARAAEMDRILGRAS